MVIKCSKDEEAMLLEYLKEDAVYHTFLLADIQNFGFEQEFQTVYADIQEDKVQGVYLKFYGNLILAGREGGCDEPFLKKLLEQWTPDVVMGKESLVKEVSRFLPQYHMAAKGLYAFTGEGLKTGESRESMAMKRGVPGDEDKIHEFLMEIPEIKALYTSKQMIADRLKHGDGTHLYLEQEGTVIAHVNSAAKSPYHVMIGGVGTRKSERGKGLASGLVRQICQEILAEGKEPCCFCDRGTEHNLFIQLGFQKIGMWGVLTRPASPQPAENRLPSYIPVYNKLYQDLMDGVYEKNSLLPSETVLAATYKVSRNTLRQALTILCQDGYIYKRQGKGTYVSYDSREKEKKNIYNFLQECAKEPISHITMDYNVGLPTNIARKKLGLAEGETVVASNNVYYGEDGVAGQAFLQIPSKLVKQADIDLEHPEEKQLLELLDSGLYRLAADAHMTIQVVEADEQVTSYMGIPKGTVLLHIEQILYRPDHSPAARIKYYFIPDKYQVDCRLQA